MNWKLFWKVFRIGFGAVFMLAALIMLVDSLFLGAVDIAYAMFSVMTLILSIIMVVFGLATLPKKD